MKKSVKLKCCICRNPIPVVLGWAGGHNAEPVKSGRCCGDCNDMVVIPARLKAIFSAGKPMEVKK